MGGFSLWHWLVVGIIILLLFGKGRFSDMMGDVAKGLKSFKKGISEEDEAHHPQPPHRIEGDRPIDHAADRARIIDPVERREP
jgi:sec-independent protein translocase protein TatA